MKIELAINEAREKANLRLTMGEGIASVNIHLYVPKTPINWFKYWLFSEFFPFKVVWLKRKLKDTEALVEFYPLSPGVNEDGASEAMEEQ